jgi:hypothetical protein
MSQHNIKFQKLEIRRRPQARRLISSRTQKKDSFAEHKTLPRNDFLHFAESASLRDFTRPSMPLCDTTALAAPTRSSETRMNTRFSPA